MEDLLTVFTMAFLCAMSFGGGLILGLFAYNQTQVMQDLKFYKKKYNELQKAKNQKRKKTNNEDYDGAK